MSAEQLMTIRLRMIFIFAYKTTVLNKLFQLFWKRGKYEKENDGMSKIYLFFFNDNLFTVHDSVRAKQKQRWDHWELVAVVFLTEPK